MNEKYEFGITLHKYLLELGETHTFTYDFAYDPSGKDVCIVISNKEYEFFCEIRVPKQYFATFWNNNKDKSNFINITS